MNDEKVVIATLKAAAAACEKTCGRWQIKNFSDGAKELFCPCAIAVMEIDPKTIIADRGARND